MEKLKIHFLGTRGSMAVEGSDYEQFGGATVCVLIKHKDKNIILDAGSGFMDIEEHLDLNSKIELDILISHSHIDHIMGFLVSKVMFNPKIKINIYLKNRNSLSAKEQINLLMNSPIWPVNSDAFLADVHFFDIQDNFEIGDITINVCEGNHAGGVSMFSLECEDAKIVYATDFEINEESKDIIVDFSKNADLLICDGQYSDDVKAEKIGFGHSTWQDAINVAQKSNAKRMCVFHHDPYSTDEYLKNIEEEIKIQNPKFFLAKKGDEINL